MALKNIMPIVSGIATVASTLASPIIGLFGGSRALS